MEGEHLHPRHIADAEGIDSGEPRPQRCAITVGLLAQEVDEYLADPSGGGAVVLGVRLAGGIGIELVEEVVGEGAESGGRLTALGAVEEPALDRKLLHQKHKRLVIVFSESLMMRIIKLYFPTHLEF